MTQFRVYYADSICRACLIVLIFNCQKGRCLRKINNTTELYLCTPIKVDDTRSYYIVGYEPNATMNTAHHMLLYGCEEPGLSKLVWDCGEMSNTNSAETASPCGVQAHSQILYAWARDAPKLSLPEGVGFKIGLNSQMKYMVLQVHYANIEKFKGGATDDSGVFIHYTLEPMNKLAGVILLGTGGVIPPKTVEHMETACEVNERKTIYPIAYRTHTHSLGKVVSGYRVRSDEKGVQHWSLLGKRDPLTTQMFYTVENKSPIEFGDYIAARCTMESNRTRITEIGPTNKDEMCNFYLMYYVENDEPLSMKYCFSQGQPYIIGETPMLVSTTFQIWKPALCKAQMPKFSKHILQKYVSENPNRLYIPKMPIFISYTKSAI